MLNDGRFNLWESLTQRKIIELKKNARWQHISPLKAKDFCSWLKKSWLLKKQQLILETGTAIWWVTA
jgi:hypothetical protein